MECVVWNGVHIAQTFHPHDSHHVYAPHELTLYDFFSHEINAKPDTFWGIKCSQVYASFLPPIYNLYTAAPASLIQYMVTGM